MTKTSDLMLTGSVRDKRFKHFRNLQHGHDACDDTRRGGLRRAAPFSRSRPVAAPLEQTLWATFVERAGFDERAVPTAADTSRGLNVLLERGDGTPKRAVPPTPLNRNHA